MMESFRLERKQLRLDNYKQRKIITKLQRESESIIATISVNKLCCTRT